MKVNLPKEPFEIEINTLSSHGEGIGRYNNIVVFVPGALPYEKCLIQVTQRYKNFARAKLIEVVTPSPHRVIPPCAYFPDCGGCQLQHLNYSEQVQYKQRIVSEILAHIGHINIEVNPVIVSEPFRYRNKMVFPLTVKNSSIQIGLHRRYSYKEIVPIESCLLLEKGLNALIKEVISKLNECFTPQEVWNIKNETGNLRYLIFRSFGEKYIVALVIREDKPEQITKLANLWQKIPTLSAAYIYISPNPNDYVWDVSKRKVLFGDSVFPVEILKIKAKSSPSTFLQVNWKITEKLYHYICSLPFQENNVIVDAYCGLGLLSLALAEKFNHVIGIDADTEAIQLAQTFIANNKTFDKRIEFIAGAVEEVFKNPYFQTQKIDAIILDPPRAGCHPKVIKMLGKMLPRDIVLVSCHTATLARDLQALLPFGYIIFSVQPFDMFPQTFHVETVTYLRLNKK